MEHTVPPEILYSSYWYRSGTNQTMRDHLRSIAEEATALAGKTSAQVLDIGCNDGTLLANYPETFTKFGVDPSNVALSSKTKFRLVQDVFPSAELLNLLGDAKLDIITAIAMFYDLEDPCTSLAVFEMFWHPNGLWIFEMSYMPSMLEANSYDTICVEHLEYYSPLSSRIFCIAPT
jgi:trans-aconitate methyltransferase